MGQFGNDTSVHSVLSSAWFGVIDCVLEFSFKQARVDPSGDQAESG